MDVQTWPIRSVNQPYAASDMVPNDVRVNSPRLAFLLRRQVSPTIMAPARRKLPAAVISAEPVADMEPGRQNNTESLSQFSRATSPRGSPCRIWSRMDVRRYRPRNYPRSAPG